jgi:hypothetical protein
LEKNVPSCVRVISEISFMVPNICGRCERYLLEGCDAIADYCICEEKIITVAYCPLFFSAMLMVIAELFLFDEKLCSAAPGGGGAAEQTGRVRP